jgi:hypothetical protein
VEANDVAQIAVRSENGTEDFVEFRELHLIGDRDQADDHGAHLE